MIKTNKVETTITKLTTPKKKSQHLEDDSSASNSNQIQKKKIGSDQLHKQSEADSSANTQRDTEGGTSN